MNDIVVLYGLTVVLVGVVGAIMVLYRYLVADKYLQAEKKLRLKLNEATSYFRGDTEKAPDFIQKSIGSIGIEGLMEEFGIDPKLLNNPLVRGLVDKYAPKLLERLQKGKEENETPVLW